MIAADTNVVVRCLIEGDDPRQATLARTLFDENNVFITVSVMLETEWVLRTSFGFKRQSVLTSLRQLAGLPTVTVEAAPAVKRAIDWASQGLDFADALHLAMAGNVDWLATFDRDFVKGAPATGSAPVRLLSTKPN